MPTGAFTPIFEIYKGGESRTANFRNRAVSIEVNLVSGNGGGDSCSITVDDRDWLMATPQVGDGIEVYLGYEEIGTAFMGTFQVDRVVFAGPQKTITVHGNSVNFAGTIKSTVTKNIEKSSFSDVVSKLLQGTGYTGKVEGDLGSLQIPYMNITTSPLNAINDLSKQYGGIFKISDGVVAITKRDSNNSVSGQSLGQIVLNPSHFAEWSVEHLNRHQYDKVTAKWKDPITYEEKAETVETSSSGFLTQNGEAAGGDKVFGIKGLFGSQDLAKAAAKAKQAELDDSLGQGNFRLAMGDPWIRDSMRLILTGFRTGVNGSYTVDMVRHIFTKDGALQTFIVTKPPNTGDTATDTNIEGTITVPDGGVSGQALPQGTADGSPAAQAQYPVGGA